MPTLQDHPIAAIFPLLPEPELDELAKDIETRGVQVPLVLYEGKILDGRNRYRAARRAGKKFETENYKGKTPLAHVISLNLRRRHLNESQRGMVAAKISTSTIGGDRKSDQRLNLASDITIEAAAGMLNVSRATVVACKSVLAHEPEQAAEIENGSKTVNEVKREIRKTEHKAKVAAAAKAPKRKQVAGPFDLIVADPPWQYDFSETGGREVENHYPTATPAQIAKHAPDAKPDSVLFLWATAPKLVEALAVMSEWGFSYRTHAVWDKEMVGMGYWFRGQHELLLVGTKGKPGTTPECERVSSVFRSPRGKHSTKPEAVYAWIERAFPDAVKLEMYCREPREGWAAWGNEV